MPIHLMQRTKLPDYSTDPVGWVHDVLPRAGAPYAKQVDLFILAAANRRVSVVGCNGSGKDWAVARLVLWWIETRPKSKALVTGPTQRQVEEVVWREMRVAYGAASASLSGQMYASRYFVTDERFALGFATDHPYNLQGFHSPDLLAVVTEAHAVGQDYFDALKRLNPKLLLLSGNPLQLEGEFYDSHHTKKHLYATLTISAFDTPNLREGRGDVIPGMLTPADVEERRLEWGEDHDQYKMAVLGEFPDSLPNSLLAMGQVRAAVERWKNNAPESSEPWIFGVDVARYGTDKTIICMRRGSRVEEIAEMQNADTMDVVECVVDLARLHRPRSIMVDGIGVGGGVVDRLRELGMPAVDVQVGVAAHNPAKFTNLRAEIFWRLRERFEAGAIAIPDDRELTNQLLGLQFGTSKTERTEMMSKKEMRQKGMKSPDKADALALAFMERPRARMWL